MELRPVGEGSSFAIEARFTNYLEQPTVMASFKYLIRCRTTNRIVRDWTQVTPELVTEIKVAPEDNLILNDRNQRERRELTIVANDDTDTQFVDPDPVLWWVVNTAPGRNLVP